MNPTSSGTSGNASPSFFVGAGNALGLRVSPCFRTSSAPAEASDEAHVQREHPAEAIIERSADDGAARRCVPIHDVKERRPLAGRSLDIGICSRMSRPGCGAELGGAACASPLGMGLMARQSRLGTLPRCHSRALRQAQERESSAARPVGWLWMPAFAGMTMRDADHDAKCASQKAIGGGRDLKSRSRRRTAPLDSRDRRKLRPRR
jgi:hypothetical protein